VNAYQDVPIEAARHIAEAYDKHQVIVVTWDKHHHTQHVTTYGKTFEESKQAAQGGNRVKAALGWPDALCHAETERPDPRDEQIRVLRAAAKGRLGHGHNDTCDYVRSSLRDDRIPCSCGHDALLKALAATAPKDPR
jgi:hypothetical protein